MSNLFDCLLLQSLNVFCVGQLLLKHSRMHITMTVTHREWFVLSSDLLLKRRVDSIARQRYAIVDTATSQWANTHKPRVLGIAPRDSSPGLPDRNSCVSMISKHYNLGNTQQVIALPHRDLWDRRNSRNTTQRRCGNAQAVTRRNPIGDFHRVRSQSTHTSFQNIVRLSPTDFHAAASCRQLLAQRTRDVVRTHVNIRTFVGLHVRGIQKHFSASQRRQIQLINRAVNRIG